MAYAVVCKWRRALIVCSDTQALVHRINHLFQNVLIIIVISFIFLSTSQFQNLCHWPTTIVRNTSNNKQFIRPTDRNEKRSSWSNFCEVKWSSATLNWWVKRYGQQDKSYTLRDEDWQMWNTCKTLCWARSTQKLVRLFRLELDGVVNAETSILAQKEIVV